MNRSSSFPSGRTLSAALAACATVLLLALPAVPAEAQRGATAQQERRVSDPPILRRNLRNVLGGVPMTAADSAHQRVVRLLDFDSYKELVPRPSVCTTCSRIPGAFAPEPEPREEVFATKIGGSNPGAMYILGAHMDGRGGGEAANDDGSGTALVMEIARVLATEGVVSDVSIRFALWNNEETGLNGARAYVEQRAEMQGIEDPPGSSNYPEPRWLGMIQHDMMMWDHGNPVTFRQALDADVDVEFQLNSTFAEESARLGLALINANRLHATDYPAVLSNAMSNTDSTPFMNLAPAVSLRENRRLYETGNGANPHWHQTTDLFETFSDADFMLGFNAAQTTLGAVAKLANIRIASRPVGS